MQKKILLIIVLFISLTSSQIIPTAPVKNNANEFDLSGTWKLDSIINPWGIPTQYPVNEVWTFKKNEVVIKKNTQNYPYSVTYFKGFSKTYNDSLWYLTVINNDSLKTALDIYLKNNTLTLSVQCDDCQTYFFSSKK